MEEEFNEHELEERLYAMLHYVDETQATVINKQTDVCPVSDTTPRSTLRRYWRTSGDNTNPYQKVNAPKDSTTTTNIKTNTPLNQDKQSKPKDEKSDIPTPPPVDLSIFQSPVPKNVQKIIQIIEQDDDRVVTLESSDEDEVIEVALPPKPTITIESSDEEELVVVSQNQPLVKGKSDPKPNLAQSKENKRIDREISASPVPSIVSSVSDDFIRGDCIALNISSRHPDNHSFDFGLHGSDLLDQSTPSARKKKKKSKDRTTSTPIATLATPDKSTPTDGCFATPKSKAKNKKQKNKSYSITERSIPSADVYDSDSNQSMDIQKNQSYSVTDRSLPSADVYESDSSETVKEGSKTAQKNLTDIDSSDSSVSLDQQDNTTPKKTVVTPTITSSSTPKQSKQNDVSWRKELNQTVDLTDEYITLDATGIEENIVMGNVSGFTESDDYEGDRSTNINRTNEVPIFGSTKVPAILYENLDFDYLKGKDSQCNRRRYSLSTLREEMEKFYNESWGGENFNHREIQKSMSKDKNLWMIDPKDRMPNPSKRKTTCNYCNRVGHRDDACRMKQPVCFMCGSTGHYEPRCPQKICVNCGAPNYMYSTMCRNCSTWGRIKCAECGQFGHPSSHCPDTWRRYHNTVSENSPLQAIHQSKKNNHQTFCSGCTRRGHLVHNCRISLPFSGLPINSPFVSNYISVYPASNTNSFVDNSRKENFAEHVGLPNGNKNERNKRQSKSPAAHETHVNKRRLLSTSDNTEEATNTKNQLNTGHQRKSSLSKDIVEDKIQSDSRPLPEPTSSSNENFDKPLDFISISSNNHDKKGQIIQDNEVSDTSDVVTSARIYITNDIVELMKTAEGLSWLKSMNDKHGVEIQNSDTSFLSIKGNVVSQEAFQIELRDWISSRNGQNNKEISLPTESDPDHTFSNNIPKNRNNVLRKLNRALESLKDDIGDPKSLFKELTYLQNHHQKLLHQKVISPKQVSNSRYNINNNVKKLNMVLLGQAGLADGPEHVSELHSLIEKITNFRQKNISHGLRKEIGQHYHCIFTALPRDDYSDLIQKYYGPKPTKFKKRKAKENSFKMSPKLNQNKNLNVSPSQQKVSKIQVNVEEKVEVIGSDLQAKKKENVEKTKKKLILYGKKLMSSRPADSRLKKTRQDLVRRLHTQIASLRNNSKPSAKSLKKMRKLQDQVQLFLTNI